DAVHTQSPPLDGPFLAELRERAERARPRRLEFREPRIAMKILGDIVDPNEVDAVDAETLQAVVNRPARPIGRIVVDDLVRPTGPEKTSLLAKPARSAFDLIQDDAADFGAQRIFIALVFNKLLAEPDLGKTSAIERCGVEISRACLPCRVNRRGRFFIAHIAEHVSQWRSAKTERAIQKMHSDAHGSSSKTQVDRGSAAATGAYGGGDWGGQLNDIDSR